jgi:hypothetical protein
VRGRGKAMTGEVHSRYLVASMVLCEAGRKHHDNAGRCPGNYLWGCRAYYAVKERHYEKEGEYLEQDYIFMNSNESSSYVY